MGIISALAGLGGTFRDAGNLAEVFVGNRGRLEEAEHTEFIASLDQLGKEFEQPRNSWFDSLISGMNRLPRPALAMGTLGLFVYSMVDPIGFAGRMQGLSLVPDPLWWLLGAIVSFYFGARELHHFRTSRPAVSVDDLIRVNSIRERIDSLRPEPDVASRRSKDNDGSIGDLVIDRLDPDYNAALEDWRASKVDQ